MEFVSKKNNNEEIKFTKKKKITDVYLGSYIKIYKDKVKLITFDDLCFWIQANGLNHINQSIFSKFYREDNRNNNSLLNYPDSVEDEIDELFLLTICGFINKDSIYSIESERAIKKNLAIDSDLHNLINNIDSLNYDKYISSILSKFCIISDIKKKIEDFKNILENIGLSFTDNIFTELYRRYINNNDKILIILTPGDNIWFKSNKKTIAHINYERCYDGKDIFIYYNWDFIKKFIEKIAKHPRCVVAFLSSLSKKNLKENFDIIINEDDYADQDYLKYAYLLDEECHDKINPDSCKESSSDQIRSNKDTIFKRNLSKIMEKTNYKFNEKRILILESDEIKAGNISKNIIKLNCFSEGILLDKTTKANIDKHLDKLFDEIRNMLDSSSELDIPKYLKEKPIIL